MMEYYTLQISFGNVDKPETMELKDLSPGDNKFFDWSRQLRENLWRYGFQKELAPGTYDWIPPLFIYRALLMKQDRKYGI